MSKMSKKEQVTSTATQKRVRFVGVPEEDQVKEASSSFQGERPFLSRVQRVCMSCF